MKKKEILELLLESYGLKPKNVKHYRTNSNGGEYKVGVGWSGAGINKEGKSVITFEEPHGFNMAIYEILRQAKNENLNPSIK